MKYVQRVLQPGEVVVHETRLHWLIFLRAIMLTIVTVALFIGAIAADSWYPDLGTTMRIGAGLVALWALVTWFFAWLKRVTTEFAITDRRVIFKTGLISRRTIELDRSKVEGANVDQTVPGRLLNYGTIVLRGTGATHQPIRYIADPLTFRSHITAG